MFYNKASDMDNPVNVYQFWIIAEKQVSSVIKKNFNML